MNGDSAPFPSCTRSERRRHLRRRTWIAWGLAAAGALAPASAVLAQPTLAISDTAVQPEGNSGYSAALFTVTRSAAGVASSVQFRTGTKGEATPGSACGGGVDFVAATGSLAFAAGETTKTITVTVCADTIDEPEERFPVELFASTGATIADPSGVARIVDDDPTPSLEIRTACPPAGFPEGNAMQTNATFVVMSSAGSGLPIRVEYATPAYRPPGATFSATPGVSCGGEVDFVATSGRVEIPAGPPGSATITVPVCGDTRFEAPEDFPMTLSNPVNATIRSAGGEAECTIANDELPLLQITDASVTEPAGAGSPVEAVIRLELSQSLFSSASIHFTCVDGTAVRSSSKSCDGSGDYVLRGGTIDLPGGARYTSLSVPICHDTAREGTQTFQIHFSSPVGMTLVDSVANVTILDND